MWLFMSDGFVSIVKHHENANTMLVRGRKREHVEAFVELAGTAGPVVETPGRDYRWRTTMSYIELEAALAEYVRHRLHYGNFKASVSDPDLAHACSQVWRTVGRLQEGGPYGR